MQAPPFFRFMAMTGVHAILFKFSLAKAAGKKAPFSRAPLQLDDGCAFEPGLGEDHVRLTRRLAAGRRERVVRGATPVECLKSDLSTPSAISR